MFHGFAVIDKSAGMTSHDVVSKTRKLLEMRKVGHSGTLDPSATGVMVVGVGKVTRLLGFLKDLPKRYVADVVFGVETSTLDADGELVATHDMSGISLADVKRVAAGFMGEIKQIPPMVSAVRVRGKRLHEWAREGKQVDRPPRMVRVDSIEVLEGSFGIAELGGMLGAGVAGASPLSPDAYQNVDLREAVLQATGSVVRIDVRCGSGTYIRTLAADIGTALGGGAHVATLRRLEVGSFDISEAVQVEKLSERPPPLLPPSAGMRDYPSIAVDEKEATDVSHGRCLPDRSIPNRPVSDRPIPDPSISDRPSVTFPDDSPFAITDQEGNLLAVYTRSNGLLRPKVVLPTG